eukprot:CAMPEP_0194782088 /NCGR_PEP_ID=MMETSP0323_2-20130528/78080_1 /TAXON_ID=2866 ORGANISM="Crypthecodinium cohnii, Strain Seligo" /NCGR_SAMPLE_ID=MMETSP0323_2 /ASSEMBLY_ACC=CAM_ASM_000346 /LENGTH=82 /DNA_ID=CAMNT_0039720803 /DNA_START=398 /DNA_END=646 /DNA_ORIENTATION=-
MPLWISWGSVWRSWKLLTGPNGKASLPFKFFKPSSKVARSTLATLAFSKGWSAFWFFHLEAGSLKSGSWINSGASMSRQKAA